NDFAPQSSRASQRSQQWRELLPPARAARFARDELSSPRRLIRLFRDSYLGAQGRQWLQPHILWWIFKVLRRNGISPAWRVLDGPQTTQSITALDVPKWHADVNPRGQTVMNFGLWWSIMGDLVRLVYLPRRRCPIPDAAQLQDRAWRLGLRPWM